MSGIFSAFGLSASAGLNAYIPLLIIAISAKASELAGWQLFTLDEPWSLLSNWWIIGLLVVLSAVEFFADKIPAVNHANDIIQTFIRPTAGAIAFASSANVITDIHPVISLGLGLLVAGSVHTAKAGALRPAVTAMSGGTANPLVSVLEDIVSTVLSIMAIIIPMVVGVLLFMFLLWFVWWLYRRSTRRPEQAAT